jgi:hypothetical protein
MKRQVTTDPIELWAAPESRSRVERKFFDETFRPFYRTEQIIIHAKNLNTVIHEQQTPGGQSYKTFYGRNLHILVLS